jgi:hypothetical protein
MTKRNLLAALAAMLSVWSAYAADYVWLIGGGPNPDSSQGQIELNVNWVIDVLRTKAPEARRRIFYTNGKGSGRDVKHWANVADTKATLQPLARVFGVFERNGDTYRSNRIEGVAGGTEAESLKMELSAEFSRLKPGDQGLLIYNGHGQRDRQDAAGNTLSLWKDTDLSARELEALLGRVPASVPVRFVLTQCYAGGFARMVHPGARDVLALAEANRCGFMAESESRVAEGCSASINIGDYRDYTTYFFAAFSGLSRAGEKLEANPDLNGDRIVSLYEAHLYALAHAHNADLPRATSEVFLERWQPWYLRWFDTGSEPDNIYGRLARQVARRLGLPHSGRALGVELSERRAALIKETNALLAEKRQLNEDVKPLQRHIQYDLALRWPEAIHPHTLNYARFLQRDLDRAQEFILAHPVYRDLAGKQDRLLMLDRELLTFERDVTQLEKVRRLRSLARLLDQFQRHASRQERAWYARLLACEQTRL